MNLRKRLTHLTGIGALIAALCGCFPISDSTLRAANRYGWQSTPAQTHKCIDWGQHNNRPPAECPSWARWLEP